MKKELEKAILQILADLGIEHVSVTFQVPQDSSHGDLATNVALTSAKILRISPREVAETLKTELEKMNIPDVQKIEVAGAGFLNLFFKDSYFISQLSLMLDTQDKVSPATKSSIYDKPHAAEALRGKKIMVEFTDPNPFKEFHIGHLYSNIVGESLARLFESQGAQVKRADYFGDVGLHVAKALFGLRQMINDERLKINELEKIPLEERVKVLGEAYAKGAKVYEEDPKAKEEINDLNKKLYAAIASQGKTDTEIYTLYQKGKEWSLQYFETIFRRLGTKFDYYYPESVVGNYGVKLIHENMDEGVFVKDNGAVVFKGESVGLHTRVFINSLGLPTYEAKELGLNWKKYQDYPFDLSVIVTGSEINEYFKVLLAAMKKIFPEIAEKTKHIGHGMVRLLEGKMSSRTGNIITGEWLLDEVKVRIKKAYLSMTEETAEMVAVGAVKYALLKSGIGKDIEFSFESSISFEGNSGPYLQYTYARTQSVIAKKARQDNLYPKDYTLNMQEKKVLLFLGQMREIVCEAAEKRSPSTLATYLFELAKAYNYFYQKDKIIGSLEENFRLALTQAVGKVLKEGLDLLGIQSPEKM